MLRYLFLVLVCIVVNMGYSAGIKPPAATKPPAVLKTDSSVIKTRRFNEHALETYRKAPEFQYHDVEVQTSLWTRFWRWFWNWVAQLFSSLKVDGHKSFFDLVLLFFEYLIIALGLGAIIFMILKLVGIDMFNVLRRKPVAVDIPYSESLENIHEIDFDTELDKAINQQNYRLAVRMLYLKCLKQLSDSQLIDWQPDKTNSIYINELVNPEQRDSFKLLTRQFEYIWYGEFTIDLPAFNNIHSLFRNFRNSKA